MKNIILVDFEVSDEWEFHDAIEEATQETWEVQKEVSNMYHGNIMKNILRYIKYFYVPLKVFFKRKEYKNILAWQQFYGLILAFYFKFFRICTTPSLYIMTFIYKPKKGVWGKIYHSFIQYIVTSEYVERIIVFSESEKIYYSKLFNISEEKFLSTKLGIEDASTILNINESSDMKYYLSAGRSNRDYEFLIEFWKTRSEVLKIVSDSVKNSENQRVIFLNNCYNNDFFNELAHCYAVIVPLKDIHASSGQLVVIQAMMFGKPVIITDNETVRDYITNGLDGIIINKNKNELTSAIELLNDYSYYEQLSENARKKYELEFGIYSMGLNIGKHLKRYDNTKEL